MSRADEIAQGLREPNGCLTFCLVAEEYSQGHIDYDSGTPPPSFSTPSYDLGRWRAQEKRAAQEDALAAFNAEQERRHQRLRAMLADKPEILADYDAKMAEIRHRAP